MSFRIIIIDDHKIVRDGLKAMLFGYTQAKIIGEANNAIEGLELIAQMQPDLVFFDLRLPDMNGSDLAVKIKSQFPEIRLILLTAEPNEQDLKKCLQMGVEGFLTKEASRDEYYQALNQVLGGSRYLSSNYSSIMLANNSTHELSERECEVLILIAEGLSYKEMADRLQISARTVETHKKSIHEKLNLLSTAELVKYAIRQGLVKL